MTTDRITNSWIILARRIATCQDQKSKNPKRKSHIATNFKAKRFRKRLLITKYGKKVNMVNTLLNYQQKIHRFFIFIFFNKK